MGRGQVAQGVLGVLDEMGEQGGGNGSGVGCVGLVKSRSDGDGILGWEDGQDPFTSVRSA